MSQNPVRTFSANIGDYSTGNGSPDRIEADIDSIITEFTAHKQPTDTDHDGRYYTEAEVDTKLQAIIDSITSVTLGQIQNQSLDPIKFKQLSRYMSAKDSNDIYTVVDYKRTDGTLYMKSTLSGGATPNYTTDTWNFYDAAGTSVILTLTWTFTRDGNGNITSMVVV